AVEPQAGAAQRGYPRAIDRTQPRTCPRRAAAGERQRQAGAALARRPRSRRGARRSRRGGRRSARRQDTARRTPDAEEAGVGASVWHPERAITASCWLVGGPDRKYACGKNTFG